MTDDSARRRRNLTLSEEDRGISDAIGFVLVFAIITASIAVFYATGFEELRDTRDQERTNNAQRAFDVFRSNMQDIAKRGAPSRATEIKVSDAQLYVGSERWINVSLRYDVNNTFVGRTDDEGNQSYRPLIYETDERSGVVYANGAVFRQSGSVNYAIVQPPDYVFDDDRVLMTVMATTLERTDSPPSVSGSETVLVRALAGNSQRPTDPPGEAPQGPSSIFDRTGFSYDILIEMRTPLAEAWARYFESQGLDCTTSDDELSCETQESVRLVQVLKVPAELRFES
jgi:hypothetical protein